MDSTLYTCLTLPSTRPFEIPLEEDVFQMDRLSPQSVSSISYIARSLAVARRPRRREGTQSGDRRGVWQKEQATRNATARRRSHLDALNALRSCTPI